MAEVRRIESVHQPVIVVGEMLSEDADVRSTHGPVIVVPTVVEAIVLLDAWFEQKRIYEKGVPNG